MAKNRKVTAAIRGTPYSTVTNLDDVQAFPSPYLVGVQPLYEASFPKSPARGIACHKKPPCAALAALPCEAGFARGT